MPAWLRLSLHKSLLVHMMVIRFLRHSRDEGVLYTESGTRVLGILRNADGNIGGRRVYSHQEDVASSQVYSLCGLR